MKTLMLISSAALFCFGLTTGFSGPQSESEEASPKLPGAMPIVNAADYASLQEAIDAIPASGGMLTIPPGIFEIDSPLLVRSSDTTIIGSGAATHIKNVNEAGEPALLLVNPEFDDKRPPVDKRLWRIRIADLQITGNEKSGHGIEARFIDEIYIHGVSISRHGGDGIHLNLCYEDPRISDNLITYNKGTGLKLLGCHDIIVSANQFEENQDALHCFDSFNLTMTGNNLDDHLGHGVVIENTYGSVVAGNMIEECAGTAVILDRDCYGNTLSANVIAHNGAGIDLRDAHGCTVTGNTMTIMKSDALKIGAASGRIAVTGNNFSNSFTGEGVKRNPDDLLAAGVVLESTRNIAISGNVFADVKPKAILAEGTNSRILVDGNVFVGTDSDHSNLSEDSLIGNNIE